jgi:hypothetical protein
MKKVLLILLLCLFCVLSLCTNAKNGEWGDVGFAKWASGIFGNKVKFNIFTPKDGKYIPFSSKSKIKDYGYGKMFHKNEFENDFENDLYSSISFTNIYKPIPFKLKEYKINDSIFYKSFESLCNIFFSENSLFSLIILDSLHEFYYFDDSVQTAKVKQSNCIIFPRKELYKDAVTTCDGYFIFNDRTFLMYIENNSTLSKLFQPTGHYQKFHHNGKRPFWYFSGYSAWHLILKKDNSLQYVEHAVAQ